MSPCIGPTCLPDYPNGEAPKECLLIWRGCYFSPEFFVRIVPATLEAEADGVTVIAMGQGYRFLGVPADTALGELPAAELEANAGDTSTGDANQYYQKGRENAGFTPSAATPGTSNHGGYTLGAVDCYTDNEARRSEVFPLYGLDDPIGDEPWHWQQGGTTTRPIPTLGEAIIMAALECGPIPPDPGTATTLRRPVWLRRPATLGYRTW